LPDLGVVAVAQRAPKEVEDLRGIRGLDGRHHKGAVAAESSRRWPRLGICRPSSLTSRGETEEPISGRA